MDTTTLLGPAEVRELLLDVIARHPDNINPKVGMVCAYTDPGNPERHCLIGQLAVERGWVLPLANVDADFAARLLGWPVSAAGADFLGQVQEKADDATDLGHPWSAVTLPEVPS